MNIIPQFARNLFATKPEAPSAKIGSEEAWSESSMYRGADFPKYNPDDLLSRKGYAIYSKMMLDEQVKAVVRFKRDAITSRDFIFELDDADLSEEDIALRKEVFKKAIADMGASFTDSLNGVMSAMYNGFSITEKVLGQFEHDGKTWYGIGTLKLRPCDTFFFHTDEYGNIQKFVQQFDSREQELDIENFIHYVQNPDFDTHYGRSELRECYRAWFSKDMVIKFQNIHLERFAAGFVWAAPKDGKTLTAGTPEYTSLQSVMKNLQASSSIILPSSIELNIEHPATTDAFERAIAQHDKAIAKALLVPNLLGISEQGSTGSYSQSKTQLEAFLWTLDADATRLEQTLNVQLFKQLGDLNFGDGKYPKFKFKPISDERKLEIVKIWTQLVTAGAVQATDLDEAYIREALEMPKKAKIEGNAPDLVLNGAQVTALIGIVAQVGAGSLSPEAAKALITAVFQISEEQAAAMVDNAKVEKPEPVTGDPATSEPMLPPVTGADGKPLTPEQEETIVGKMGITVSAFRKMFWNEDQPRDDDGKFAPAGGNGGGGGGSSGTFEGGPNTAAAVSKAISEIDPISKAGGYRLPYDSPAPKDLSIADALSESAMAASSLSTNHTMSTNASLKVTQSIVDLDKVQETAANYNPAKDSKPPIVAKVGKDYIIIDGHHRIAAAILAKSPSIKVHLTGEADSPKNNSITAIGEALDSAKRYSRGETVVGKMQISVSAFSKAMKRVDFAVIANKADNSTKDTAYELATINSAAVARLVAKAEELKLGTAEGNPDDIKYITFTPAEVSALNKAATKGLAEAWAIGTSHAKKEVSKAKGAAFATNDMALQDVAKEYLKAKGYTLAGDISAATQKTIRNILMEGVKVSKTAAETKQAIYKALEADGMLTEEAVMEALGTTTAKSSNARIETAIRTTSFEAINEARYQLFSDPALDGFVEALEYSAVLDDRTTEICSQLNGETYGIDSDVWSTFRPPNHFNCRSILVPVTTRDTWTEGQEPSVMPQKGFGFHRTTCKHKGHNHA